MEIGAIGQVSEDEGVLVHMKDAAGNPLFEGEGDAKTPVNWRIAGTYSKRYRAAQRASKEKNLRAARRNEDFDVDDLDAVQIGLEVACIMEWHLTSGGVPFAITAENWKAVIDLQPQWQQQVQKASADHAAFFKPS